jgi:hypothetical protein
MHVTAGLSSGSLGKSQELLVFAPPSHTMMETWSSASPPVSHSAYIDETKAVWTPDDEALFIQLLWEKFPNDLTDNEMFKEPIYAEVAKGLNTIRTKGTLKNVDSCKNKWKKVRMFFVRVLPVS